MGSSASSSSGLTDQRARHGHALALAAGHLVGPMPHAIAQAHALAARRSACSRRLRRRRCRDRSAAAPRCRAPSCAASGRSSGTRSRSCGCAPRPAARRRGPPPARHRACRCRWWACRGSPGCSSSWTCPNPRRRSAPGIHCARSTATRRRAPGIPRRPAGRRLEMPTSSITWLACARRFIRAACGSAFALTRSPSRRKRSTRAGPDDDRCARFHALCDGDVGIVGHAGLDVALAAPCRPHHEHAGLGRRVALARLLRTARPAPAPRRTGVASVPRVTISARQLMPVWNCRSSDLVRRIFTR